MTTATASPVASPNPDSPDASPAVPVSPAESVPGLKGLADLLATAIPARLAEVGIEGFELPAEGYQVIDDVCQKLVAGWEQGQQIADSPWFRQLIVDSAVFYGSLSVLYADEGQGWQVRLGDDARDILCSPRAKDVSAIWFEPGYPFAADWQAIKGQAEVAYRQPDYNPGFSRQGQGQ